MDKRQRRILKIKNKDKKRNTSSESNDVLKMIKTKRVVLDSFMDYFTHYAFTLIFAIFPLMIIVFSLKGFTFKWDSFLLFIISLSLFGVAFFMQYHRLRFKQVSTTISLEDLHKIIKETAVELDWQTSLVGKGAFASTRPSFWSGSWGEEIKIFIDKKNNQVLVNSICRLDMRSSVFAAGRNRRNEQRLIRKIKEYEKDKSQTTKK
ncbi:hypothetical protein WAF17_12625 [Bernardetia sp. ABR2-2B]|uniref:hypothetical protein n=1 Tax=Bernardetia sp. ABR2-2B TaxID=3127472 RepID=UPI0030D46975